MGKLLTMNTALFKKKEFLIAVIVLLIGVIGILVSIIAMKHHSGEKMHHAQHLSMDEHDEINMPGLQGEDITDQEIDDLKNLFQNHQEITRIVENLPNGIKTLTTTPNEELRESLVDHVTMMITRLQEEKNPKVFIQSPTLDELFQHYDVIDTEIELTDEGVALIQTSEDPQVVALLQKHAAEIVDMVDRGMEAVHERMMKSESGSMKESHHQGEYAPYKHHN